MSTSTVRARLLLIGATVLAAFALSPPQHTADLQTASDGHNDSHMFIDSKGASAMMRRQQETRKPAGQGLLQVKSGEVKAKQTPENELYVLIGDNLCSGGGSGSDLWKRYELNAITPGSYSFCAQACSGKEECVGFDVGTTGCNLYTQKAVAIGTWPNVQFNANQAFAGTGSLDDFPQSPTDLTLSDSTVGSNQLYKCYRKTYYKPVDSYYWLIGDGTCSGGGGPWKRYKMTPGTKDACENACNLRDECVGFDVGTWEVQESVLQVDKGTFETTLRTTTGCFMYAQKAVHGSTAESWPGVELGTAIPGTGSHDDFPTTPYELVAGDDMPSFNINNATKCYGKSHWVSLAQYYMELGKETCEGGGMWKHYKMDASHVTACKEKCDEKEECVGLDHAGGACRFYTSADVSAGTWAGVTADGPVAFAGSGDHDRHTPTPFSLSPTSATADSSKTCLAKTHFVPR